jgi:hypothetical protein
VRCQFEGWPHGYRALSLQHGNHTRETGATAGVRCAPPYCTVLPGRVEYSTELGRAREATELHDAARNLASLSSFSGHLIKAVIAPQARF